MSSPPNIIADRLSVPQHPTVVRLDDLQSTAADWISDSYFITQDVKNHLHALNIALKKDAGTGIFLIGHFGSGKSHFLAYLIQQIQQQKLGGLKPETQYLSLVNFSAAHSLESIVSKQLGVQQTQDRREAFDSLQQRFPQGVLLILDELSEFLRSKSSPAEFSEDIRFLQFMGEWAQENKFWIMAAMQEQIEHTGDLDNSLYRKIKDRYPLRFLLSPVHVRDLISETLLLKKPGYDRDVQQLVTGLTEGMPKNALDLKDLAQLYPLHPVTLEILEEVRDCFSQARGIVEFVITQLRGHEERRISPFLQRPWGELLTPDYIVDHFRDLFEIQPEFVPLSSQCLAWYRQHLDKLFAKPKQQNLAKRLIKLLILIYISPTRSQLLATDAVAWLMFRASRLDASRNVTLVQGILDTLVEKGRFVERKGNGYQLNLSQDSQAELANHLRRAQADLQGKTEQVFDTLSGMLDNMAFNPFVVLQNEWQSRSYRWHSHERPYQVCLGEPAEAVANNGVDNTQVHLSVGLPWQPCKVHNGCALLQPASMELTPQWLELAAMLKIMAHPLSNQAKSLLSRQIQERAVLFHGELKQAYQHAKLYYDGLKVDQSLMLDTSKPFVEMVEQCVKRLLNKRFPSFERFAPSYGPLPKDTWLGFLNESLAQGVFTLETGDASRLVQEAYLAPMGLIKRRGREFAAARNLDRHELVSVVLSMLQHEPAPATIYQRLAEPVYGLVTDQVHGLLYFLLLQGELDIVKDKHSLRDHYQTLVDPRQYDKVLTAQALSEQETAALTTLLKNLGLKTPAQWSVSAQRNALDQLQELARENRQTLHQLSLSLPDSEKNFKNKLSQLMAQWQTLGQGDTVFQGWQQFLYEIESIQTFTSAVNRLADLPRQINHFLAELGRYQHIQALFQQHMAQHIEIPEFEPPPSMENPDEFEQWLRQTGATYQRWQDDYSKKHMAWWAGQNHDQLLSWQADKVSKSRHLGLAQEVATFETLQHRVKASMCQKMGQLEYQPFCHCGFDGDAAPVAQDVAKLTQLKAHIEQQLTHFFKQDKVKKRVEQWLQEGVECNQATQDYIANKSQVPEIAEIKLFDNFLSGVEISHVIDGDQMVRQFADNQWEPGELASALQQWAMGFSQYATLKIQTSAQQSSDALLEWIAEQALTTGTPLPETLSQRHQQIIDDAIRAEWVKPPLWKNLDNMGFTTTTKAKLLRWLADGSISDLPRGKLSPSVDITRQLQSTIEAKNAEALATTAAQHYRAHTLLIQVDKAAWLSQLEQLATTQLAAVPTAMADYLSENMAEQWLLLDAFGLPLLDLVKRNLSQWLPGWETTAVDFALVSAKTTTDAFYRTLLKTKGSPTFIKINAIDDQIHQRFLAFDDLEAVLETELSIAIKNKLDKLRADQTLMISGDHGFRISKAGHGYEHGGPSTLERVVPVIQLRPITMV